MRIVRGQQKKIERKKRTHTQTQQQRRFYFLT